MIVCIKDVWLWKALPAESLHYCSVYPLINIPRIYPSSVFLNDTHTIVANSTQKKKVTPRESRNKEILQLSFSSSIEVFKGYSVLTFLKYMLTNFGLILEDN
jgi:hypothetical protein